MRCGHCRSCTNPKLKQACFTRRAAEGGPLPSGSGLVARAPPVNEPGIEFWPAPAVVKRRLLKLLEALLRPEVVKGPPRKRVRKPVKRNRSRTGERTPKRGSRGEDDEEDDGGSDDDDFEEEEPAQKRSRPQQLAPRGAEGSNDENAARSVLRVTLSPLAASAAAGMKPLKAYGVGDDGAGGSRLPKPAKSLSKVEKKMAKERGKEGGAGGRQAPLSFFVKPPKPPSPAPDAAAP